MKKVKVGELANGRASAAIGINEGGLLKTPVLPMMSFGTGSENRWAKVVDTSESGFCSSFLITGGYYSNSYPAVYLLSIGYYNRVAYLKLVPPLPSVSSYKNDIVYTNISGVLKIWVKLPVSSRLNIICLMGNYQPLGVLETPPEDSTLLIP